MRRKTISILAAIALALFGVQAAHAVQCPVPGNLASGFSAGPVNPNNGFAEYVADSTTLSLELCLDPANCFFDPVVAGNLFSQQIGFGAEAFWWLSEATIDTPVLSAIVVMAAEAAFLTENPADGEQFPFTRLRIRADVPQPGVYTVTHPYGTEEFTVEAVGAGQEIRTSNDIEFVPNAQGQGCVGPWLRFEPLSDAPPGFIGDGATAHAVTGSPTGNNFFRISAVDLNGVPINLSGGVDNTVSTDLFTVYGKVYDGQLATPMVVNRTSYDRADAATGQVDVFTTGAQSAVVTFNGGPNLPAGPIPLLGGDPLLPGSFFASIGLTPDASVVPPLVEVNATDTVADPATDPTRLLRLVTDVVTITRAEYNLTDNVLTVEAASSDVALAETLTLAEYGVPVPAQIITPAPPGRVNVFSAVGGTTSAQVVVISNTPPVAADDAFTVAEDSGANILNVLADNGSGTDTDADGTINAASVAIVAAPAHGTAVNNGDGTVTYTPNGNFNGTDTFTYTVEDNAGILSNVATVTVTVTPVNDNPVAADDSANTAQDTAVTIDVLANDTDADNLPPAAPNAGLTVSDVTQPANGSAVINVNNVTYTPNTDFAGPDTFTYTVSDGGAVTDTATVTVLVNRNPVANDDTFGVNEDSGATPLNVLGNDTDADGDTLTITAVIQPAPGSGTVTNNVDNVSYTPPLNFNGTATFGYTVSDGNGGTDNAVVTVNVAAINDNPLAFNDSATTNAGTPVTINVLANDADADGDSLTITSVFQPAPTGSGTVVNNGTNVTYTPPLTFSGLATFTYTISDGNGGEATATVAVTVNADAGAVDLDISAFRITSQIRGLPGTVTIRLDVRNNGAVNGSRPATVVGVRNNVQVYSETRQVSDAVGGGSTAFNFTSFPVTVPGNITWTATIADDNPDVDQATATTRVR
jgi:hypothetical protein